MSAAINPSTSPRIEGTSAATPLKGAVRAFSVVHSIPAGGVLLATAGCVSLATSFIELLMAALFGVTKNAEVNNEFARAFTDALKDGADKFFTVTKGTLCFGVEQFKEAATELCFKEDFTRRYPVEAAKAEKVIEKATTSPQEESKDEEEQDIDQGDQFLKDIGAQFNLDQFGHEQTQNH